MWIRKDDFGTKHFWPNLASLIRKLSYHPQPPLCGGFWTDPGSQPAASQPAASPPARQRPRNPRKKIRSRYAIAPDEAKAWRIVPTNLKPEINCETANSLEKLKRASSNDSIASEHKLRKSEQSKTTNRKSRSL